MKACGFEVGRYNVTTYYHKERRIRTLIHGDDFVSSCSREDALWFKASWMVGLK